MQTLLLPLILLAMNKNETYTPCIKQSWSICWHKPEGKTLGENSSTQQSILQMKEVRMAPKFSTASRASYFIIWS